MCRECQLEVHDITMMAPGDAEEFLAERMSDAAPKLDLHRRPDGRVMDAECARGAAERRRRRVVYALGIIGASFVLVSLLR